MSIYQRYMLKLNKIASTVVDSDTPDFEKYGNEYNYFSI